MPIVIEGLAELSEVLTTLAPQAAKRYLSRCAKPAAQVVLDEMGQTVPVGIGRLEECLTSQKTWDNDGGDETTMLVVIGPTKNAFWGSLQEFGTKFQTGTHWMGRAWESSKDRCLDVFATEALGILADLENKGAK
jgi:HK97 gp10 family phage protein